MSDMRIRAAFDSPVRRTGQAGFTLVELIISLAIGLFVATALTSVILTSVRASNIALGRIEASSEIRAFEERAYDDFASSTLPATGTCGDSAANPCSTAPLVLMGVAVTNSVNPVSSTSQVTYVWDGSSNLDRTTPRGATEHLGTDVTGFAWYIDASTHTVVVQMTVTVLSYSETQTFRFDPRLT